MKLGNLKLRSLLLNKRLLLGVAFIVVIFIALNSFVLPWYVHHGETMHVPNVVGVPVDSAKRALQGAGLVPVESDTRPDVKAPAGTVVSQNPDADAVVKNGRHVYLTVSGGEVQVVVPALRGRSMRDARFALERCGLRVGDVEFTASDAYPENTIVEQSVQPGLRVAKATLIKLVVSRGKELQQVTVMDYVGKTLTEAQRLIEQQGLKVGNITYQANFDLIPNTVVDQFPRAGDSVPGGQAVDLFVVKAGKPQEEIQHPKK